jgi:hypothetical protein
MNADRINVKTLDAKRQKKPALSVFNEGLLCGFASRGFVLSSALIGGCLTPKKNSAGTCVPAEIKEARQLPAQHRQLQLQASEEERLLSLPTCAGLAAERRAYCQ